MIYCYGSGYTGIAIYVYRSNNWGLVSLRYIAVDLAEICSGKDGRAQRFHANWVGVKNTIHHERNFKSSEYNMFVKSSIQSLCVLTFIADLYQNIVEHLSNIWPLFRISHALMYLWICICQINKHFHCYEFYYYFIGESLLWVSSKRDEKQEKFFLNFGLYNFYIIPKFLSFIMRNISECVVFNNLF